jgi:hypothetical protein
LLCRKYTKAIFSRYFGLIGPWFIALLLCVVGFVWIVRRVHDFKAQVGQQTLDVSANVHGQLMPVGVVGKQRSLVHGRMVPHGYLPKTTKEAFRGTLPRNH